VQNAGSRNPAGQERVETSPPHLGDIAVWPRDLRKLLKELVDGGAITGILQRGAGSPAGT
jgi:hypothetical protein